MRRGDFDEADLRPKLNDAANLVAIITGIVSLLSVLGSAYLAYNTIVTNRERIETIEQWRYEHERVNSGRIRQLDEVEKRVDACCPFSRR